MSWTATAARDWHSRPTPPSCGSRSTTMRLGSGRNPTTRYSVSPSSLAWLRWRRISARSDLLNLMVGPFESHSSHR
jgi:hypothetical protein